ncbi:hypothetical protein Mapa_000188 [Marchantia paleacea]|nr:hypothetical protein Mapa_000188 [Marchantia paleacea]
MNSELLGEIFALKFLEIPGSRQCIHHSDITRGTPFQNFALDDILRFILHQSELRCVKTHCNMIDSSAVIVATCPVACPGCQVHFETKGGVEYILHSKGMIKFKMNTLVKEVKFNTEYRMCGM